MAVTKTSKSASPPQRLATGLVSAVALLTAAGPALAQEAASAPTGPATDYTLSGGLDAPIEETAAEREAFADRLYTAFAPPGFEGGLNFQYAKYCGGGHPVQPDGAEPGERIETLRSLWAPQDDLDALCFAHDYCFEVVGMDTASCDFGLAGALYDRIQRFDEAGRPDCGNLSAIMFLAFLNKPWSNSKLGTAIRVAEIALVYDNQTSTLRRFLNTRLLTSSFRGFPAEHGTCTLDPEGRLDARSALYEVERQANAAIYAMASQLSARDISEFIEVDVTNPLTQLALEEARTRLRESLEANPTLDICYAEDGGLEACREEDAAERAEFSKRREALETVARLVSVSESANSVTQGDFGAQDTVVNEVKKSIRSRFPF